MKKKKLAMVFDGLGFGGIERVGVDYANIFIELGYEVDVINLQPEKNEMVDQFPKDVRMIAAKKSFFLLPEMYMAGVKRWRWGKYVYPIIYPSTMLLMQIEKIFRRRREKYDIAVAFSGHFRDLCYVAYHFVKSEKKLCWLHGGMIDYLSASCTYGDLYKKIKNMVVLSEYYQDMALNHHMYLKGKIFIDKIYNPIRGNDVEVDQEFVEELQKKYGDFLLMVGRFERDKDQKTVIKAIDILKKKYRLEPNVTFVGGVQR